MTSANAPSDVGERTVADDRVNSNTTDTTNTNLDEIIAEVRKPEHQNVQGWSVMRLLYPFHDLLTRVLIRSSISSRQLTVAWFLLSLVSFGVSAIGMPETFLAGAVILFVAIVLDLCDGEIGRARAKHMSAKEDLRSFIKGMFLDRMCHTICTPLWPIAVAWGLYRLHDHWQAQVAVMVAGLAVAAYQTACRALPHLGAYLAIYFRDRVIATEALRDVKLTDRDRGQSVSARAAQRIEMWIRNGKRFNFMILVASAADVVLAVWMGTQFSWVLWVSFVLHGAASIVLLIAMFLPRIHGSLLVEQTIAAIEDGSSHGN